MITLSTNILKKTKDEPVIKRHYGFQLIAKKLADQLKSDIGCITPGEIDNANINNITQAKSAIRKIEQLLAVDSETFSTERYIDNVIDLYNDQRPATITLHSDDYKAFTNQLAFFQTCRILTKINPDLYLCENGHEYGTWIYDLFEKKVKSYSHAYLQLDDSYIWVLQELLFAIDIALPIFDTENEYAIIDTNKKRNHMFSGYLGFEEYLKSLYRQYNIDSTFFPEFMSEKLKSDMMIARLDAKHREMINYEHYRHKAFIDSIIDPIMNDLKFLRSIHKLYQPSSVRPTLQCHIENLADTIGKKSTAHKAITVEIMECLIILYEPILGEKYTPSESKKHN